MKGDDDTGEDDDDDGMVTRLWWRFIPFALSFVPEDTDKDGDEANGDDDEDDVD